MYVFVISLCIVAAAFVVQRFANQIDEQLNACGTGTFKDGACVCQHPYTGTHCEIVDCGYGKLIDSVFAYDTITTPKGPSGCECEAQYWGFNCANCTSKYPTGCTGPCKDQYFGSRCDILCKSGTENDKQGVEHREAGGTYNYFVESRGFCLNYGNVKGTVKCREGYAGAHCQHECLDCKYGSCNLDDGSCDCFDGYFGNLCQGTCPGRCSGLNGVCQEDGTCKCYDGFTGDDCSKECCVEGRGTELSSVHGTCLKDVGGCNCSKEVVPVDLPEELYSDTPFHGVGWEGSQCDCHENITCGGRGRCVEGGCECTANFQGARCDICNDSKVGPFCQYDRWQCPDRDNAHGEFVAKNSRGDYGCKCNSGFTGDTCEECIASAYPKTPGDKMCTIIIPDTLCHDGSVNPNYDGTVDMCICDTNFDTQTDCASCHDHWYGPDCDHYCRESTVTDALDCGSTGGVCSNSGPGCICPKGSIFSGTKAGGTCVTCGGDDGCANGNCIEGRCRCDPNYYGDNCNISPPKSGDKVCSGYPSVIIETAANCGLTADCLDETSDNEVNKVIANQARIYDRIEQMFCHRDDTPKGLKNTQGCCVDKNGDGFCDKDKLQSSDCTFINAAGYPEDGEVVNDICNKRVLEDETNVFEWCLSQERACTSNGVCEDPELCENRCDAGLGPDEWVKIWEWGHSRMMTDVMSEPWKFASDVPDPYEYRDSYGYVTIDDVCVAGEMYDVCRDYLIPNDANVFNLTHKFTDKWEPMPNYQDCTLTKVISVNVDGKVVIDIDPIHAGMLETTEDNTAVFGRYQNGEAAYTGTVDHMIDSITVFGKGFTGAKKLTILIYDYESDTCSDFVRKVGSHYDLCSQIKFHELDYDWGAFCKWRPTSLLVASTSPTPTATYEYSTFSSGTCASNDYEGITTGAECNEAARQLGYNTAIWSSTYTYLSGAISNADTATCYASSSAVRFNYNNAGTSTLQCTATDNCVCRGIPPPSFDDKCYRQSTVCTAGCDNYQEGCEGLPLLSEHPTPMPAPCDQHWGDFCTNYMDFEHKEEGVCAYTECRCEGYGIGGPACDMQCPVPAGVDTELSCGSDLNMGKCIKDRGVIAFGVEQGKCDCFNGGNPAEGCAATCEGEQDCSSEIDTPFSFEYSNCTALSNIDSSNTGADLCHVFLRDSACNFFRGRCECATPFTAFTDEEKPIYLNPHSSYRIALMQGYDIDEYLPFTTYDGTVPDRDREAFESFDPNFKCFKDIEHTMEVSCDWIRALKHFARGGSYRIGDCTNLAPGTDIVYQVPCSGHGFPQGGTCACDYAEEFETRSSGVGLSFEQPGLDETPWRGKACQFICPGYDMESMDSVCSGHGRCESDARCACDQGWTGYKCDLQCEVEQKPLTCSGHGVCDERSIILRGDIIKQLDGARCEHLPECNAANYDSGDCTNETMTLARDRVIKSGDSIYHMYYDEAIKISTYSSSLSSSVEFLSFETSGLTVRNADAISLNPDINVCSDFTLKKIYEGAVPTGGPVILRMIDSYGDGWNGFQLNVGGTTWGDTFTDGTIQTAEISGLYGTIEVTRDATGNYVGEVSFEIICKEGNALLLSGDGGDESWTFENTCPAELTDAIVIRKGDDVIATLTEIGEFSVTGAEGVYTYSDIVSSIGGSLTVTDCSAVTRNAVLDDFSIEGTAVRHDYDFGSNIPFMPCQDRMDISREHAAHPLLPEMSSVDLPCNVFAQKQVVTENGADEDYFRSYQIMCGVCNCEESSQTGNWTGYDCRTPALGFFRSNARSQCPGMTADMNPCNGGGTCRWGSTDGLGIQIRDAATKCYCGDVTDEATLETAPRSEYGVLVHASSHGTPLFYDEIDEFAKDYSVVDDVENIVFTDTGEVGVCVSSGTQKIGPLIYEKGTNNNPGTTESERVQACGTACVNSYRTGDPVPLHEPWTGRAADDSTLLGFSVILTDEQNKAGRCYCNTQTPETCGTMYDSEHDSVYKWYSIDSNLPLRSIATCPNGTEPIKHAEDCRHGFKTDEPYSIIPSFQYCEMPDKSDQVQTIGAGQTGDVDEVVFKCYESCIDGQKTNLGGDYSDPLFWSKHTKEDITHFSVATDGSSKGGCICYATNVDDCKDGDASVPLTSYPNTISYRINHHSHPYDLTTGSSNTIPALSSLTTGTCQKEFEDEVFTAKEYGPTTRYKASSSVCTNAYELDGTTVTPNKDTNVYSTRLTETDPLYDRDPTQECANRCHAKDQNYDGFMILSYVPSGNINSCLCGKGCDTPRTGFPYFKVYTMRTVPDPYEIDNTQSICHPSPLRLSNYKSDCSCKFGFTGNTCETARMMCLWNGEETDGTECICNDDGEPNTKVSKYGCCTKGTYWDQDKYASFTPLSEFEPIPANRFYQDAFLYVCKPPETLLEYENDQERILDIHNYVANTDEYLLTKPTVCGDAPEKQLFTSVFQTLTSKSPETFTVTRVTGDETRDIVVDKDKTILELKEGSEPKEQCAAFCVSKNKGYKGFSIFTPKPELVRTSDKVKPTDAGAPNVRCENDDRVPVYGDIGTDSNPGYSLSHTQGILDACYAACQYRPRVSKTKVNGYAESRPQNFWEVYSQEDITYIYIHDLYGSDAGTAQGSCSCHTGDLDTCETVEAPVYDAGTIENWYQAHTYKLERGDTECTCEPFIANMDNQVNFIDPMSYEDNEGWDNALPRTTKRYDIQFPVDIEAEAQNLGCFENIDGRVLKINQLAGTSHSISAAETAYVDRDSARSSVGLTFEGCYEECKHDDVFEYGYAVPELPRYGPDPAFPDDPGRLPSYSDSGYSIKTEGICEAYITTEAECLVAATALGLGTTDVSSHSWLYYARGCFSNSAGSDVYFNTNTGSSADCGSSGYNCICGEPPIEDIYEVKTEGPCFQIQTAAECEKAAEGLDGVPSWKSSSSWTAYAPGCFLNSGGDAYFNTNTGSTHAIGESQTAGATTGHICRSKGCRHKSMGVVASTGDCYDKCRYEADLVGFLYGANTGSVCWCEYGTPHATSCTAQISSSWTRYSISEYLMSEFTELTGPATYCDSAAHDVRPYGGSGDNPGTDLATRTLACHDACMNTDGANIMDGPDDEHHNGNFWNIYGGADVTGFMVHSSGAGEWLGRCYCFTLPQNQADCETLGGGWKTNTAYTSYKRNPPQIPEEKTCTCYSGGNKQIVGTETTHAFQISSTGVGALMNVQKNPAVNPAPCNVNSYIALGDDIVGDPCNCPIGALEEAYVETGFQRSIVNGICDSHMTTKIGMPPRAKLPYVTGVNGRTSLVRCEGDCDSNSDCIGHLECWQRDPGAPGPSAQCEGNPVADNDYCYDPKLLDDIELKNMGHTPANKIERCEADCDSDIDCGSGLVCYQRANPNSVPYHYMSDKDNHYCMNNRAPTTGTIVTLQYAKKLTDTADPLYDEDIRTECSNRCRNDGVAMFSIGTHSGTGEEYCGCSYDNCGAFIPTNFPTKNYLVWHDLNANNDAVPPGCKGSTSSGYDICVPGEWLVQDAFAEFTQEQCENACRNADNCDSYSYTELGVDEDTVDKCRLSTDCAGFEYRFAGVCDASVPRQKPDKHAGVLPNIRACRDRCADYKGFLYNEDYRDCVCEDADASWMGGKCGTDTNPTPSDKYTRYGHNFEPVDGGINSLIFVQQPLSNTKGRYCATSEEELYTVSITDPRADAYACAQNATLQGMEVARGSVNGLTFTCYVSDTYYANPNVPETDIIGCLDFRTTGGPQYILQAGMQRRIGIKESDLQYQRMAIKDELFNTELYPSDTAEGCKVHCDPYKYRHFQFSDRDKTCQCIKKEKSLLTLTGDPNDMVYNIYDFTAGLIDSPHEMCFCEGFYLVDGQAKSCPSGKYSSKLTPCSAACTNCPVGQFSDAGASECGACVAGQIQDSPTSCSRCDPGQFAKAGAITCSMCEVGRYASGYGAGECTLCPTGKYQEPGAGAGSSEDNCKNCPAGWEQPNMEQTDCDKCGTGKYTVSTGTEACALCGSGKYQDQDGQTSASACNDCAGGKYQGSNGQASCKNCASGKYQDSTGKTSCSYCTNGKYQGSNGQTTCKSCSAGYYQGSNGQTSCTSCSAGYYSGSGKASCTACSHGQYQSSTAGTTCESCGSLSSNYQWVRSPYPHTNYDLSCDQYRPCEYGGTWQEDCGTMSDAQSGSGGSDKRTCCHYQQNWFCTPGSWLCTRDATGDARCYGGSGGGFDLVRGFTDTSSGRDGIRSCEPPAYGI